jgi:transcription antitermination factor NusA-like protein
MPKRLNDENLGNQSQKKIKWTLQDIEVNSIDQLIAQPSPAFKETLEKLLATNNEEIASHSEKIVRLIDEQDQKNLIGVSSKVSFLTFLFQKLNKCLEDLRE